MRAGCSWNVPSNSGQLWPMYRAPLRGRCLPVGALPTLPVVNGQKNNAKTGYLPAIRRSTDGRISALYRGWCGKRRLESAHSAGGSSQVLARRTRTHPCVPLLLSSKSLVYRLGCPPPREDEAREAAQNQAQDRG